MATIILKSDNPDFSFILQKNPASIPLMKSIRKGVSTAWYYDNQTYCLNFKDSENEVSFKEYRDQEYEYLTISSYNSSLSYNSLLKEFFTIKKQNEKDIDGEFNYSIELVFINLKRSNHVDLFQRYFKCIKFESVQISPKNFKLILSTNESFFKLINIATIFTFYMGVLNGEDVYVDDGMMASYVDLIKRIDSPFFIRYIFKSRFLRTKEMNNKFLKVLQDGCEQNVEFIAGDLQVQRRDFLLYGENKFFGNRSIIDLGCGEGFYTFKIAEKIVENSEYIVYPIDINKDLINYIEKKAVNKGVDNIICYTSIDDFFETQNENVDVLCTEMLEHLELDEAEKMIIKVLKNQNVHNFVITTPNKDFNEFYNFSDDEMRHGDHKWEMKESEFKQWICSTIEKNFSGKKTISFFAIGDKVNGIQPSIGCCINNL